MDSSSTDSLLAAKAGFQAALAGWYRGHARPLPWRDSPTLYKTVVSEFMLQQTQVKTVLPYFARWLEALPTFADLAAAPEDRVLKLWEGLGYYSRARNLHRLAKALAAMPEPPATLAEWRELPGVGPYTAAAVTSIAFSVPAACVDGNVVRILARMTADATAFRDSGHAAQAFGPLANELLPDDRPGNHNQAMMELGATVCFRRSPNCVICPIRKFCRAGQSGDAENYPRLAAKKIAQVSVTRVWRERRGELLLHLTASGARRFANMHELPTAAQAGLDERAVLKEKLLAKRRRGITRYQVTESIFAVPRSAAKIAPGLVWVPFGQLADITLSGPHRRWVTEILATKRPVNATRR